MISTIQSSFNTCLINFKYSMSIATIFLKTSKDSLYSFKKTLFFEKNVYIFQNLKKYII